MTGVCFPHHAVDLLLSLGDGDGDDGDDGDGDGDGDGDHHHDHHHFHLLHFRFPILETEFKVFSVHGELELLYL